MYGRIGFEDCIKTNLKSKGFGPKRAEKILTDFSRRYNIKTRAGMGEVEASFQSMHETLDSVKYAAREQLKRANKTIQVQAELTARVRQAYDPSIKTSALVGDRGAGLRGGIGSKMARAATSVVVYDERFKGVNYETKAEAILKRNLSLLGDAFDKVSKGKLGIQRGAAHLPNIVREAFGQSTGDATAKAFSDAYKKLQDSMLDHFNRAGGSIRKRLDFNMPQRLNSAKLTRLGEQEYIADAMEAADWSKIMDEAGNTFLPEEREQVLRDLYAIQSTDGAVEIKPESFGGRGHAVGNQMDKHRFFVYKDAESWLKMHEKYGDGNAFEVIIDHIRDMSRKTALVDTFGPNPNLWIDQAKARVRLEAGIAKRAADKAGKKGKDLRAPDEADEGMRKLEDIFTVITRQNAINPDNQLAAVTTTGANILTSAQLTGAVIAAVPGDTMSLALARFAKHMPVMQSIDHLVKDMVHQKPSAEFLANSGFMFDEAFGGHYAAERYTGLGTYGAPWSRVVSDSALRLSGLTRWTNTARGTAQRGMMSMLGLNMGKEFDQLPYAAAMAASGITKRDWDAVRKAITPQSPVAGTKFFVPTDIMKSKLIDRDQLYYKFYGFIHDQSRLQVPASTVEASVALKGTLRPDNIPGLIMYSFGMYKNFPVTLVMQYGRMILNSQANGRSKLSMAVAMGLSLTFAGALAIQMRELARGKEPQDMTQPGFWARALASGGGLGIWGDMLFGGVNQYGARSIPAQIGGPVFGAVSDIANATLGQPFRWVQTGEAMSGQEFAADMVQLGKRYTPYSNLWYSRLAIEREVWNRLEEMADPKIAQKRRRLKTMQRKTYGNDYLIEPGDKFITNALTR